MERPISIVRFERYYLAALGLKILFIVVNWRTANAAASQIGTMISLLLWFGVVYKHSIVSRWAIVALCVLATLLNIVYILLGRYDILSLIIVTASNGLNIVAAAKLLSLGADRWFEKEARV